MQGLGVEWRDSILSHLVCTLRHVSNSLCNHLKGQTKEELLFSLGRHGKSRHTVSVNPGFVNYILLFGTLGGPLQWDSWYLYKIQKKKKGCFFSAVKLFPTLDLSENILLIFFKVTTQIVCKKTKKFKSTVFLQSARSADYKFYSVWMTHYLQSIFFSSIFHVQFTTDQTGNMLNP